MKIVRIGRRFYQDCVDCCCDVPEPQYLGPTIVSIDADDPKTSELISRAWLYVHPHGPGVNDRSLMAAAKRTLKALGELC